MIRRPPRSTLFPYTRSSDLVTVQLHLEGKIREWYSRGDGKGRSEETRLNSSHMSTSYAVFCLKKKTLIGLGVAIDYSLLVVSLCRAARSHGRGVDGAVEREM